MKTISQSTTPAKEIQTRQSSSKFCASPFAFFPQKSEMPKKIETFISPLLIENITFD